MRHSSQNQESLRDVGYSLYHQPFHNAFEKTSTNSPENSHHNNNSNSGLCHQTQLLTSGRQISLPFSVMPETTILSDTKWHHHNLLSSDNGMMCQGGQKENAPMSLASQGDNFPHVTNRINRVDSSVQHVGSLSAPQAGSNNLTHLEGDQYEEIDEEENSDFEEEEEMMRQIYYNKIITPQHHQLHSPHHQQQPLHPGQMDATSSLLTFAKNITNELQNYLHKNKEQDDACDIYEDKWATTKSGRELYYADLLRIAQGDTEPPSSTSSSSNRHNKKSSSSKLSCNNNNNDNINSKLHYTPLVNLQGQSVPTDNRGSSKDNDAIRGFREASLGLGPLEELFEYGLKKSRGKASSSSMVLPSVAPGTWQSDSVKRGIDCLEYGMVLSRNENHRDDRVFSNNNSVPMHQRVLPESFWKEPKGRMLNTASNTRENQGLILYTNNGGNAGGSEGGGVGVGKSDHFSSIDQQHKGMYLVTQKLPDFTDLMENWHGGGDK